MSSSASSRGSGCASWNTGHKDNERQDDLQIVRTEKVGVDKRQDVVPAKSQGDGNRMVDMLVDKKTDIHAL
jgi:hypothetical protein